MSPIALRLLRPFTRYSYSRDAYILRLVGARFGPVLRMRGVLHQHDLSEA